VLKYFSVTPPENSGGAENSTENSGPHAKTFFCSMYEMSQRHQVWVAENHVTACNSAETAGKPAIAKTQAKAGIKQQHECQQHQECQQWQTSNSENIRN
jgi:hypothetical protein